MVTGVRKGEGGEETATRAKKEEEGKERRLQVSGNERGVKRDSNKG